MKAIRQICALPAARTARRIRRWAVNRSREPEPTSRMAWPPRFDRSGAPAALVEEGEPSVGAILGQIGVLGWTIVVPTLIGLFIGAGSITSSAPAFSGARRCWSSGAVIGFGRPGNGCISNDDALPSLNTSLILTCLARAFSARRWGADRCVPLFDAAMERPDVCSSPITPAGIGHSAPFRFALIAGVLAIIAGLSVSCHCSVPPPASWPRGWPSFDLEC